MENQQFIDIIIDELTPCLIDSETGEVLDTEIESIKVKKIDIISKFQFDWLKIQNEGAKIFALKLKGLKEIEGLIAYNIDESSNGIVIRLVESTRKNIGKQGKYKGVGGHLFAFACKQAKELNYDCVYFVAKTRLKEHYQKTLGAEVVFGDTMIIEEESFESLIKKYYEEEEC